MCKPTGPLGTITLKQGVPRRAINQSTVSLSSYFKHVQKKKSQVEDMGKQQSLNQFNLYEENHYGVKQKQNVSALELIKAFDSQKDGKDISSEALLKVVPS